MTGLGRIRGLNRGASWKGVDFSDEDKTELCSLSSKETARFGAKRSMVEVDGLAERGGVDDLTTL